MAKEWPRWCYHREHGKRLFSSELEMKAAGKGWMTFDEFHKKGKPVTPGAPPAPEPVPSDAHKEIETTTDDENLFGG